MKRDPKLRTSIVTPDLIEYIVQKIVAHVAPRAVIVFGSHASGQAGPTSDLDLFVIQDNGQSNREIRRKIDLLLFGRRFAVDIIVRRPEEVEANLKDRNPFYVHHIFGRGKVVYDRSR
ncbi:MAG: nucleotidyltransferase domain-containing protein [Chloroflexi bacterium]|nr:nucleotidyltransferase domain-containing protein [Chloroflexota bacterium]